MISAHIFSITKRLLGVSSLALLFGHTLSVAMVPTIGMRSSLASTFCLSGLCGVVEDGSSVDKGARLFAQKKGDLTGVKSSFEVEELNKYRGEMLMLGYTPPSCSDTDTDQTNNCGPRDSGDAGTRMSI